MGPAVAALTAAFAIWIAKDLRRSCAVGSGRLTEILGLFISCWSYVDSRKKREEADNTPLRAEILVDADATLLLHGINREQAGNARH